ncbi:MAG: type II secretion system protein [Alphaproteobacteria bacterium]
MKSYKENRGFTTVELAMVLIIFSMVTLTVMTGLRFYTLQQQEIQTKEAFEVSQASLHFFVATNRRYPCPASPTAARGTAAYGQEQKDAADNCTNTNGVRRIATTLDQNDDDVPDTILVGSVPFDSILDPDGNPATDDGLDVDDIPLRDGLTYDGYGHRLTYAVTENLTRPANYNDAWGAILVVDEFTTPLVTVTEDTNGNDALDPGEDNNGNNALDLGRYAHIALVSHGEDGTGARAANGSLVEACPMGVVIPGIPVTDTTVSETENCDWENAAADNRFLSGLRYDDGDLENDDTIKFQTPEVSGLWNYVPGSNQRIMNTNGGRVGFGTEDPGAMLDVAGKLRADFVESDNYCDSGGDNCLIPQALGGDLPQMKCAPGKVVVSIEENKVHCEEAFTGNFMPRNCPIGCSASGFKRDGNTVTIICRDTSWNICN